MRTKNPTQYSDPYDRRFYAGLFVMGLTPIGIYLAVIVSLFAR